MKAKFNENRFWEKVDKARDNGCWVWKGATNGGAMRYNGKPYTAVRLSWIIHKKEFPPKGMLVLHRCKNKKCVNPNHLFLGTVSESIANNKERGLNARGAKVHRTVLTDQKVKQIKDLLRKGVEVKEVASRFNVTYSTVYSIYTRRTWKHIL